VNEVARPKSDLSSKIVDAARRRFLRDGVEGASLRGIAQDAGTNIGMVYYYFKTKDDLFLAVVEDVYAGLLEEFMSALSARELPPEARLLRLFERAAAFDDRELEVARLILREALVSSERLARVARRFEQGHVPLMIEVVLEGLQQGRFDGALHPAVLLVATATLAIFPQMLHHVVTKAGLPFAPLLPTRPEVAAALGRVLLFGTGGPALKGEAQSR
jgi:AcrR family transcriptional regulator